MPKTNRQNRLNVETVIVSNPSLVNPPIAMPDLLALFERLGLAETVIELRRLMTP